MSNLRVLITGGSGLLALNWACAIRNKWDVVLGIHKHRVDLAKTHSYKLNLDNSEQLGRQLKFLAPDLIVHTAGLTNVDYCESNVVSARQANSDIVKNLALVSAYNNIGLVHISTDHLFAGNRSFYAEDDRPDPLNEYAYSKLLAEKWIQQIYPKSLIIRTNFFGWGHVYRQSFSDWIIANLRNRKSIPMFNDVYITPMLIDHLAEITHKLILNSASGIFNVTGSERVSKYEFGLRLAKHFLLPTDLVLCSQVKQANFQAHRPRDMSLSNAKTRKFLGEKFPYLNECLAKLREQETQGRAKELFCSVFQ